jgi:hypothetical protein
MDINDAVAAIEQFVRTYHASRPAWAPTESRILPSGDEQNTIKLWFNFGPDADEAALPALEQEFLVALTAAHPEVAAYALAIRVQAF